MWSRMLAPVLLLPILPLWASAAAQAASPIGVWMTDTGKGKVQISQCGQKLCAKIIWLRDPVDERGKPWRDAYNPDPAMRRRPIIGLPTFVDMRKAGPNLWVGHIYSPEEGKTYQNIEVSIVDRETLKLRGCKVMGLVCGHKLWSRSRHVAPPKKVVAAARQKARPRPQPQPEFARRAPAPTVQTAPAPAPATAPVPARAAAVPSAPAPRVTTPAPVREARVTPPRAIAAPEQPIEQDPEAETGEGGSFVVQLAARRNARRARNGVARLRRRYPILQEYEAFIERAEFENGAVWYRMRFGTLQDRQAASDLCAELIASGLRDCLVRPRDESTEQASR